MDKQKYMVTDCAVTLCKKLGKNGVSGFVNAFLRRFDKSEVDKNIPKGAEGNAVLFSYPLYAYRYLKKEYGERAEKIAMAKSGGVSVRFASSEFAEKYLQKPHTCSPFKNNFIFESFVRDDGYDRGEYTFQSVGSIAICSVVEPCESLLDACAAPGGKSVLLAEKCKNVTSFELHGHRVELIESYVKRMGVQNVKARQMDSSVFAPEYEEKFDCVLCDAPCSGFGTVTENPDIKLFRKEQDFVSLQKEQREILQNVSKYVKKGGYLVYSTCSLFERENDDIVEGFLKTHSDFEVEKIDCPLAHEKKKYGLQFLPDTAYGAGFYVCKLKKK